MKAKEGGSDSAPADVLGSALREASAWLEGYVLDDRTNPVAAQHIETLLSCLSRYERMEKALEHLSDPRNQPKGMFGIRDTRITAGWNDAAAIARQALGASE